MFARAYEQCTSTPGAAISPVSKSASRLVAKLSPAASAAASSTSSPKPPSSKKLSSSEIVECRLKGLCFHCDEPFSQAHRKECPHLFVIEVMCDDQEVVPTSEEEPVIFVHALMGIHPTTAKMMQVYVEVGSYRLMAGSMHNFVNTNAARHAGIQLDSRIGLRVAVADGA